MGIPLHSLQTLINVLNRCCGSILTYWRVILKQLEHVLHPWQELTTREQASSWSCRVPRNMSFRNPSGKFTCSCAIGEANYSAYSCIQAEMRVTWDAAPSIVPLLPTTRPRPLLAKGCSWSSIEGLSVWPDLSAGCSQKGNPFFRPSPLLWVWGSSSHQANWKLSNSSSILPWYRHFSSPKFDALWKTVWWKWVCMVPLHGDASKSGEMC